MSATPEMSERPSEPHLYKYGSYVDRLKDPILKNRLYMPTIAQLNDPTDSRPRMKPLNLRELARFIVMHEINRNLALAQRRPERIAEIQTVLHGVDVADEFEWLVGRMDKDIADRRVYSMALRPNNMSMWAKYANDHKGYCLEFANDPADTLFQFARRVIYDDSFEMDLSDARHVTFAWFFYKRPEWSNEEEVRIVLPRSLSGPFFEIPPHRLNRIILGKDIPQHDAELIRKWASQRTRPLTVSQAQYDMFSRTLSVG